MKFNLPISLRSAVPALVVGLLAPVVSADPVIPAVQGDVLLAFRDTSNSSAGSYLVNVGPISQFESASGSNTVTTIGSLSADLGSFDTTVEGTVVPWHSRSQVVWSAFSRNAGDNNTVYISRPRTSIAQQSNPWGARNGYQLATVFSEISSVIGQGYNVLVATDNNPRGGFQPSTVAGSPGYFYQVATEGRLDFASFPLVEKEFSATANAEESAIDLYSLRRGPSQSSLGTVSYLGYFSITSGGVVSFTAPGSDPENTDSDGDGISDADEDLAGTDKYDGSSFFSLPAPTIVPGTSRTFSLTTIPNRKYIIEFNADLSGPWTPIHEHTSGESGDPLEWVDIDPIRNALPAGFFRARVTNP